MELHYYHVYKNSPVCCVCNTLLTPEENKVFEKRKKEYSSVVPCCAQKKCEEKNTQFSCGKYPRWICKIPILESNKKKEKRESKNMMLQKKNDQRKSKNLNIKTNFKLTLIQKNLLLFHIIIMRI